MNVLIKTVSLPLLILTSLTLSACQKDTGTVHEHPTSATENKQDASYEHKNDHAHIDDGQDLSGPHDHSHSHNHAAVDMIHYECSPEQTILAHYDPLPTNEQTLGDVHLLIDAIEYDFTPLPVSADSTGPTAYESEFGIDKDAGMTWQVQGDEARLLNTQTVNNGMPQDEEVLFTCHRVQS